LQSSLPVNKFWYNYVAAGKQLCDINVALIAITPFYTTALATDI